MNAYSRKPTNITRIETHQNFKRAAQVIQLKSHSADPIYSKDVINEVKEHLLSKGKFGYRNWLIFNVGINNPRRCGDILLLSIGDVLDENGNVRESVTKQEQKTSKVITCYFPIQIREAIKEYVNSLGSYSLDDPLFKGRKNSRKVTRRDGSYYYLEGGYMATSTFWAILKGIKNDLGLDMNLSTHSMRKTWATHKLSTIRKMDLPEGFAPIDFVQDCLGHSSPRTTMTYLKITENIKKQIYNQDVL